MILLLLQRFLSFLTILAVFGLDRLTKELVVRMMMYGDSIEVLPFFNIVYVENTGIAFGMGQNQNRTFLILSILLLSALLILRRKWERDLQGSFLLRVGLALVIGGALGNIYDRIVHGSVIDFLDFFIGYRHWPAFNVADSGICVGAFLLAWAQWRVKES